MDRLERELRQLAEEYQQGDFGILDEYRRPLGVRGALGKLARGWLIERARVRRLRDLLDEAEGGPFACSAETERADVAEAKLALLIRESRPHVYRQLHGRHEQDKADAAAWLEKWGADA